MDLTEYCASNVKSGASVFLPFKNSWGFMLLHYWTVIQLAFT
jgi:hypothetical protein